MSKAARAIEGDSEGFDQAEVAIKRIRVRVQQLLPEFVS